MDVYAIYTRLEPNHHIEVDEDGFQWVICPFTIDDDGVVTLHERPVMATISWSPSAPPEEVDCPRCEVFRGQLQYAGPPPHEHPGEAEIEDDLPPIMGGAHGGQHHVSEYKPCQVPNRRFELVRGVSITAHEGVMASCSRFRRRYEDADGYRRYPIRQSDTGAYVCRKVTNGTSYSKHAWGVAIDINWQSNPYGRTLKTDMPRWFIDIWLNEGWGWGGNWRSVKDAMHYSKFPNEGGDGKLYVGGAVPPKPEPKRKVKQMLTYWVDGAKYATDGVFRHHIDGPEADQWYARLEAEGNFKALGDLSRDTNGRRFHESLEDADNLKERLDSLTAAVARIEANQGNPVTVNAKAIADELAKRLEQ